jgi:phosphoserine phosphatase RsbU/P
MMGALRPLQSVGVLVDWLKDQYQNAILSGIGRAARATGVSLYCFAGGVIGAPRRIGVQRNRVFEMVDTNELGGLIVLAGTIGNHIGAAALSEYCLRYRPLPLVSIAMPLTGSPCIGVDNATGLREGLRHLIAHHGYRRIAFVRGPQQNQEAQSRFQVYFEVLSEFDIPLDPRLIAPGDWEEQSGADAVRLLWQDRQCDARAIVFANDNMALGGYRALHERHLRIPDDVAVLAFDDIEEARFTSPPLTTVRQPLAEQGSRAFEALVRLRRGNSVAPLERLPTELVIRRSCGCAAYAGPDLPPLAADESTSSAVSWANQRDKVALRLARIGHAVEIQLPQDWWPRLLDAALPETPGPPLPEVSDILQEGIEIVLGAGGGVGPFREMLLVLRETTLHGDSASVTTALTRAHIWQTVERAMDNAAERLQALDRLRAERFTRTLVESNELLISSFELEGVMKALADQVPRLNIPRALVSLYEMAGGHPTGNARLILAFAEAGCEPIPPGGVVFPYAKLAPDGMLPTDERRDFIIEPLSTESLQLGFAVFEAGPNTRGLLYEALRDQLSNALGGVDLVRRLIEEAAMRETAERERLTKEMEIATRIQTAILPQRFDVVGLEIAALMIPATEVGGDYFDVRSFPGGGWIGVGDVVGHGLTTGLIMLMIQTIFATLTHADPGAAPSAHLKMLNAVLFNNVRGRLQQSHYATLTLIRYTSDGTFVFAGAHEDILVWRAHLNRCELLATPGTWVGVREDIFHSAGDSTNTLAEGDILLLHTDGISEARAASGEMFGIDRLCQALERHHALPVDVIRDAIVNEARAWQATVEDDMTLLVARYHRT